jgi:hypothetical protein
MAAPNIVNVTSIIGKTATTNLTSTSAFSVVSNAASSGLVLKINTLIVSNVDVAASADITINYYTSAALGGTAFQIASTITIPADTSLIVISKETPVYLEEDRSIGATASVANDLKVICSYEEIS